MKALALIALIALNPGPAFAADSELSRRIQHGIDAIYKMEFDDCEQTFQDLRRDYPDTPYPYFGLAASSWARFEYQDEESNLARHDEFERRVEEAIAKGKLWVKTHPDDAEGLVCVSGMYGLRSRLALMLHRWLRAYWDGMSALKLAYRAMSLNPQVYDVYTGLGMWDYYTDTLPNVIKILGRIVAIRGNAKRGIERLSLAADKGQFTAAAAKLALIELLQDRGGPSYDPGKGLRMIREIRERFPMNPLFQFVEVIYLYESRKADEAVAEAQSLLKGIQDHKKFYDQRYAPRAYVGLASAYFLKKDWTKAEEALSRAVDILEAGKGHNRWGLWALVRRGQLRDARGDRKGAVADYHRALEHLDYWELHDVAKIYLKQPATEKTLDSPITPP